MAYGSREHAFKKFNSDLKQGSIAPCIFMYGCEAYLTDWAVNSIVSGYVTADALDMDFIKPEGDAAVSAIIEACDTFSMFSEKRVVWVRDFVPLKQASPRGYDKDDLEVLKTYLGQPNPGTILIFSVEEPEAKSDFTKALKAVCQCYDFSTLDERTVLGFISKRFKEGGCPVTPAMAAFVLSESGYLNRESDYRLYNLINDIDKIIAHAGGGEVSETDVTRTLLGDMETFAFDFLDAMSMNKKETAFRMLHNILSSGKDIFTLLGLLINHFELVLEVGEFAREGVSRQQMQAMLKVHEFRITKAAGFAKRFDTEKLRDILSRLYEVDRGVKSGNMDGELALELIVAGC